MPYQVELRSREEILGDLVRTILTNTDLTDVAPGSTLATLLEAIAASQYQISLGALKILENSNLESLVGNALDKRAESMRLPNGIGGIGRKPASQASGIVTIGSSFTKKSSKFYAGKPAPFAGSKRLYLENASEMPPSGSIYIGRGTADRFEGPIPYTSVTNSGSFWIIELASPLTKNHLHSDLVVLSQGGDRNIPAGTRVQTVAANESPSVQYTVTSSAVLPDGEAEIDLPVSCTQFGEVGNALAGAIKEFVTPPFAGATVTNKTAFFNGHSTESDEDLRKRIKNYPVTLSRGTKAAILAAISGINDPDTGRTITSAVVIEPAEAGDYSRIYIDDGSGLEPTFNVQPYELLLQAASGQETLFRTAQFPITPATLVGAENGPFMVREGQSITFVVDGISEVYTITPSNYQNMNAATAYEIVRDFNNQTNILGFRTIDGGKKITAMDLSGSAEQIYVLEGDLQKILGFPTTKIRPIFVYQNSILKSFRGKTATLSTNPYNSWNLVESDLENVPVVVDGVTQSITITLGDFAEFGVTSFGGATLSQWKKVLSRKIAGVQIDITGNVLTISTRQQFSSSGSLKIPETRDDGTSCGWIGEAKMWKPTVSGGVLHDVGSEKDYKFNRFTGEIRFTAKPPAGTTIEIGTRQTRASIASRETPSGLYTLSPISETFGNARMVVGFDGEFAIRDVSISSGTYFVRSLPDPIGANHVIRLTSNTTGLFRNAQVGDYMWLVKDAMTRPAWGANIEGIYQLKRVGRNVFASPQTYLSLSASVQSSSNVVTVTLPNHGFKTGSQVLVTTTSAIGGISAFDLSRSGESDPTATITVINKNQFTYIASAAATSNATGVLDQVVYQPDCWVEFEVSSVQKADWMAVALDGQQNLSSGMVHIFKSKGAIPQIVDFGAIGTATVDDIVSIINSQISSGQAVKLTGKRLAIRSNNWNNGTVAILAVIANAAYLFDTGVASSQQSHTAFSSSSFVQSGCPVVAEVVKQTPDSPTRSYLKIDRDFTNILTAGDSPTISSSLTNYPDGFQVSWITGRQAGLEARVYNNQTAFPYTGFLRTTGAIKPLQTSDTEQTGAGTYDLYSNYAIRMRDLQISPDDKLVIEMDLNPVDKTVAIPMSKRAIIQDIDAITGSGKGQVISFQLSDPEDIAKDLPPADPYYNLPRPFFHLTSVYKNFDFRDFKILTKSIGLYREATSYNMAAIGMLTALPVNALTGVQSGDTFTISDGANSVVFEFAPTVPPYSGINQPVYFVPGAPATGSLTALPMSPGSGLDEGDSFTLSDGVNPAKTFEFDSDGSYGPGRIPVTFVHAQKATGTLTSFAAGFTNGITDGDTFTLNDGVAPYVFEFDYPATGTLTAIAAGIGTGIEDGDTFTISDGVVTKIFEFDTNGSVSGSNVPVTLSTPSDNSTQVKNAIILAVNSAGFGVTAQAGPGNLINLINSAWGVGNVPITENISNSKTLSPTGMSGAGISVTSSVAVRILPTYSSGQVKSAIITAITGSSIQITALAGIGDLIHLTNNNWGSAGNIAISQSFANPGVTLLPTGMSGGINNATASVIKSAIISAINGSGLNIVATSGAGETIILTNSLNGTAGNIAITESLANSVTLSPVGMSGGVDDPTAQAIKTSIITAINGASFNVTAYDAGGLNIRLSNNAIGPSGNVPIIQNIASGASLNPVGMSGGTLGSAATNRAIAVRSVDFGSPARLRVSIRLPLEPNSSKISVIHSNDFQDNEARCNLVVVLASGSLVAGSLFNSGTYLASIVPNGNLYLLTVTAAGLNSAGQYQPGRILNIGGSGDISGSYLIVESSFGAVTALMPGHGGRLGVSTFSASINPLSCFPLSPKTWVDIATAISDYLPANPIATAQPFGTNFESNPVALPTYISHTASTPYTGDSMSGAFIHHSFACKMSGSAGIWQYDSSVLGLNNIKATCQTDDSIFPTIAESLGTTYSPIGEEVMIVPTNSKTMMSWLNFNAVSSFTILGEAQQVVSGRYLQLSSRQDGSLGGVRVTGVTGNKSESFVIGNGTNEEFSSKIRVLSADAKSLIRGDLVKVQNSVTSELLRPYRSTPTGSAITIYNTANINTFFRQTTSIKYVRTGTNTARFVFYRFGQYPGQQEPLAAGNSITLLPGTTAGRVIVKSAGGDLAARVGDMMYIRPESNFPADVKCKGLPASGITTGTSPEYWGYPVVRVIDSKNIEVIAPNITSFGVTNISSSVDLVFLPAIYNEKNVQSNRKWGAAFESPINGGNMYYILKHLGSGVMSLWVQNSPTEAGDNVGLDQLMVNTDDLIVLGDGFSAANRGTFKIIGHNGRNHIVYFNESGGADEVIDTTSVSGGGIGSRKWAVGPINIPNSRPIRVIDGESVRIGDRLRISTPPASSQWFPAELYGSWKIVGLGYIGIIPAVGSLTAIAAGIGTGIEDGDTFSISDGSSTYTFEFDTNGSVSAGNVRVPILSSDPASAVKTAIVNAINGLGASFGISASSYVVSEFNKFYTSSGSGPYTVTVTSANHGLLSGASVTVSGASNPNANGVHVVTVIGPDTFTYQTTLDPMSGTLNWSFIGVNLLNRRINVTPAIAITESFINSVTLSPVGMTAIVADNGQLCPYIDVEIPNAINEIFDENTGFPIDKILIGGNDNAIGFVEGAPFWGYRVIGGHAVNPLTVEERELFLVPRIQTNKMSENFGTKIIAFGKLGFQERTLQGIDGYKVFGGLIRQAHYVIDGLPTNTILYPGNKAMGTSTEVLPPLIRTMQMSLQVYPKDGVTINSISEIIKSSVAQYINGLGVGKPVILSEVVRLVQGLPGVKSVSIINTVPAATDDRIVVSDIEKAFVLNVSTDITIG